jgi:hypothetical protein
MIMTSFTQRLKSVNFFQTTDFFQHRYKFQKYTIDVYTNFLSSYFSEGIFYCLCLNSSVYRYVYFKKTQLINSKEKSKTKKQTKKQTKAKYVHNIQGLLSSKVSFQGLAIHRIGVKLPFKILQSKRTGTQLFSN